ncbi:MAG: hypothetical protein WCS99_09615 [Limisphaerales bacterium]
MKHWKIALGLAALVAVSGYAGVRLGLSFARRHDNRASAETWHESAIRSLNARVKLTPPQQELARQAMDRAIGKFTGIRQQALAEAGEVVKELVAEVEAGLTPEQRQEFAKMKPGPTNITLDLLRVEPRQKKL